MGNHRSKGTRAARGGISRRRFLEGVAAGAGAVALGGASQGAERRAAARRPNILFIMTDQQHAGMMSCAGNKHLKTPAMDSLAASGTRFERAYCTNPVCLPSRFGMMTGRMPSACGIKSNRGSRGPVGEAIVAASMGRVLRSAGYEVAYGGKTHLPRGLNPQPMGFDTISRDQRWKLADACAEFIKRRRTKPFLLVASFINPHDICYMAIDDHKKTRVPPPLTTALQLPKGVSRAEFYAKHCPPLPANFEPPPGEAEAIAALLRARPFKQHARTTWSAEKWRLHRWAYCRLTEVVDAQIARLLQALRDAGQENDTVVIFTSDHGDMDAAHRMEHKTALYEEATHIPFIISHKGHTRGGRVDEAHLVSNGLDLIPTMCDYAGIAPPKGLRGRSVRALAEGRKPTSWRSHLAVESEIGRMLRTERHKYVVYDKGANREQLIDLKEDPGEMANLAADPECKDLLNQHRRRLRRWVEQIDDEIGKAYVPVVQ
jgi:choline-sulfatase